MTGEHDHERFYWQRIPEINSILFHCLPFLFLFGDSSFGATSIFYALDIPHKISA
jgi:hypothetical protein